jgi:hypothetical protein
MTEVGLPCCKHLLGHGYGVDLAFGVVQCDDDDDLCTDEGNLPGTGVACAVGQGACFRNGATVCGGAQGIVCGQAPGMPAPERCNAVDDDCDARTDEASNDVGGACAAGIGACRRQGVVVCNGGAPQCTAVAGTPVGERCNGTDDDCDGASDEGGVCDVFASCRAARAAGRDTSGIYRIGSVGAAVDVYCDQATDGGGWTLVASTRTTTLNDESAAWYADLTTLAPVSPNAGVWNGLRGLAARHDVRFACRDAVRAADAAMTSSTSLISFRLEEVSKHLTTGRGKAYWFMAEPLPRNASGKFLRRELRDRLAKDLPAA